MSYKYSKGRALTLGTETITNQVSTGLLTASVISAQSTILNRVSISSSYQLNYSHTKLIIIKKNFRRLKTNYS